MSRRRLWLEDMIGDTHALAAARIAFGILLLLQTREMAMEQLAEGYFGNHFHFPYIPEIFVPDEHTYTLLLAAQAVCAVLVVVGHLARPALFLSGTAIGYEMLCDRLHFHHNRWALACYAILLSFSPCDRARALGAPRSIPSTGDLWAVRLAQLQVSIVYVASASSKLFDGDWRSGRVLLDRFLRYGHQAVDHGVPERVVAFFQQEGVASLLAKGAIGTELFLAFGLLSRRFRVAALFVGVCFHSAIELSSRVELFSLTTFAAYLLFATPDLRARSLRYDPTRTKAVVLARVVRALDWLARFEVAPWEPDAVSKSRSFVVTDRDGKPRTGGRGLATLMRGLPLLFPIWCLLRIARPRVVVAAAAVIVLALPVVARADQPESESFGYSPYERETIEMVRKKLGGTLDRHPEGKIIESIQTERLEVFERRDFLPKPLLFVNALHATTRDRVIRREILQHRGDRYSKLAMDETARNLRGLPQLSLVVVFTMRGSAPDRVRVVVVTKDVWSLRLQWDLQLTNGGLQELVLQPAETNLAGLGDTLGANFLYQPLSTSLGGYYYVPRLGDMHLQLSTSANVILSNQTGAPEGSFGSIGAAHPLWNTHEKWGWAANAAWRDEITRVYSNAALAHVRSGAEPVENAIGYAYRPDRSGWPQNAIFADEYHTHAAQASLAVARSFGWAAKNDFVLSLEASHRAFRTDDLSSYDPTAAADFVAKNVPVSDDRAYPALEWRSYRNDFLRVLDLESFSLQEDVRLGYFFDVELYPVTRAVGSSRDFMGVYAEAGYTLPIRDGLLRLDVQTTTEAAFDGAGVIQGSIDATSFLASPRTPLGRLVFSARVLDRYADYLNDLTYLGADTRLRGYPSSYFRGRNLVAANLEYRSRPLEIWKVQVGGVAFYDVGDAFDCWSSTDASCTGTPLSIAHDVGFGLRVLFPTFDRIVFRADVGFPISASPLPADVGPVTFFVTFGQAFPFPSLGRASSNVGSLTSVATR
jgi:hypothetical protein